MLKRREIIILSFLLATAIAAGVFLVLWLALQEPGGTVSIQPPLTEVSVDDTFTLTVNAEHPARVTNFSIDIAYDIGIVEFVSPPWEAELLAGRGWVVQHRASEEGALAVFGHSPTATALAGSGALVELDFRAVARGTTRLKCFGVLGCESGGTPFEVVGVEIVVK
ncbi:MAG: hypothetical protein JSV65_09620 [Armatimonadota bacterium]|nr:MAG: hypothetical protein JSV65_09620 [Armatimonadota bacterium]